MRHLRLPNQNLKNLTSVSQIGGILRSLNKFGVKSQNCRIYSMRKRTNIIKPSCSKEETKPLKKRKTVRLKENLSIVKTGVYKCRECKHTEKTRKLMLEHLETHIGTPVSCLKCKRTFNSKFSFNWHLTYYCKKTKYKCNQCPKEFISKRNFDSHLQGHKRNNCTYCDKLITKRENLIRHLLEVHSIKLERETHKCDYCEKRYIKKLSLFHHLCQHFPEKFVCLECGQFYENSDEFEKHKREHDLMKKFKCQLCGDRFSRRQQYIFHINKHNQYKCITCKESYASRLKVVQHKQQGHEVEGIFPKYLCPHCPVAFHRQTKLSFHLRKHNDENHRINCKYCKKSFNSPYSYYKHCITISHEKFSPEITNLVCENCGKNFMKKYDLKQHIYKVHNDRRTQLKCQYCSYKTNNKCNFDRHNQLHFRKQNEFICEYCGKKFDSIATLKDHISYNHLQQKQLKCDECGKLFKRNSELNRHKNTHSDYRPHICNICGKSYKRSTHLKRHELVAHKIVNNSRKVEKIKKNTDKIAGHDNILLNFETSEALNIVDQLVESFNTAGSTNSNNEFYDVLGDVHILGSGL